MRFYEVRVIVPPDTGASELTARARGVAERIERPMKVLASTVHARPTEGFTNRHDGAIFIIDEGKGNASFYEFGGRFAVMHGMPMVNVEKFGEKTLSLKEDEDAVDEFIQEFLGASSNLHDDDPSNADFSVNDDIVDTHDDSNDNENHFDIDVDKQDDE